MGVGGLRKKAIAIVDYHLFNMCREICILFNPGDVRECETRCYVRSRGHILEVIDEILD